MIQQKAACDRGSGEARQRTGGPSSAGEGSVALRPLCLPLLLALSSILFGCFRVSEQPAVLTVAAPLHLEEHLASASLEGSLPPAGRSESIEWLFDDGPAGWRSIAAKGAEAAGKTAAEDSLRLHLRAANPHPSRGRLRAGYLYVELPDLRFEDWASVEIRARAGEGTTQLGLMFNHTGDDAEPEDVPFHSFGALAGLVSDGSLQTYRLPLDGQTKGKTHYWINCSGGCHIDTLSWEDYSRRIYVSRE